MATDSPGRGMAKGLRVGFYPGKGDNPYTARMMNCLPVGCQAVAIPRIKFMALHRLLQVRPKLDVALVSWLENCLVSRRTGRPRLTGRLSFYLKLWLLRRVAKRVVLVRHNAFPHKTAPECQAEVTRLLDRLEGLFDAVVTHSGHNAQTRHYIPHPLYAPVSESNLSSAAPYCVAFGKISPYKNLIALVEHWKGPAQLIIAGKASDGEYLSALREAAEGRPVTIDARYWPEHEAISLISGASGMVLAHSGADIIVSGSYLYALTYGTPAYALRTPFLDWVSGQDGPGLATFDDLAALGAVAGQAERLSVETRQSIQQEASEWFGDSVVRGRLEALFGQWYR